MPVIQQIFAYNTGSTISGTSQVGDIAIIENEGVYSPGLGGLTWWGGPDESEGYVIAYPVPAGDHPTPVPGVTSYIGFKGTKNMPNPFNESTFVELVNNSFNQSFTTGNDASTWLTTNGYWNSWVSITPTPTATIVLTPTPTPSVTTTQTPTITPTPTSTPSVAPSGFTVTMVESGGNIVVTASGSLNINDLISTGTNIGPFGGGGLGPSTATFVMGATPTNFDQYSGFTTTPPNFGTGGGAPPTSSSGNIFGVIFQGAPPYQLVVPVGYTTGQPISSTMTFTGQTFSSFGLTPGTYTYTWGSGANADSINVVVGGAGVTPTPTATSVTPTPTPTSGASGNFNVTISQVGNDVVWNGSGSFNLAALAFAGASNVGGGYNSGAGAWAIGPNAAVDTYSGTISNPGGFGTSAIGVTSNAGSTFGILPGGSGRLLYVPSGYVTNTNISGSSTYANTTIASAGLTPGTYTWSWGTGGNTSTLVMTITP